MLFAREKYLFATEGYRTATEDTEITEGMQE
jgi:hypothetical protein